MNHISRFKQDFERDIVHVDEFDRTCPNSLHLFPASVRQPLRNMVEDVCPRRSIKRRLSASQFQVRRNYIRMFISKQKLPIKINFFFCRQITWNI